MLKIYKELFYRIYAWNLKHFGEKDVPEWKALLSVTFLMFANILLICIVLEQLGLFEFLYIQYFPKKKLIIIMGGLGLINYFQYLHNGKFLEIIKEYESNSLKKTNTSILVLYTILSIALPFIIGFLAFIYRN